MSRIWHEFVATGSAFVFQSFNLLGRTSALENVSLPRYYAAAEPKSRATRLKRARAVLQLLGLSARERNTSAQVSGGQQQRVAIARALINAPGLLLADEPTGSIRRPRTRSWRLCSR
jgi:macrolide transport system ATP-binding/permease protein